MSGTVAAALALGVAATPASAAALQPDPERYSSTSTSWGFLATTKANIDAWLNQYDGRVIDVERTVNGNWSVVTVDNNNPAYTRSPSGSFSWTVDETWASLNSKLNADPPKRLLDIERYTVGSQTLFAAAWVDNVGVAKKTPTLLSSVTLTDIGNKIESCTCRIVDVDFLGSDRYNVITLPNTGVDNLAWGLWPSVTELEALQVLQQYGGRPVDLEPVGNDRYFMVTVNDGQSGLPRVNRTWTQLTTTDVPAGFRLIHAKEYVNTKGDLVWLNIIKEN